MIRLDWNLDRSMLLATLILVCVGLVMVFSASIPTSQAKFHSPHFLFYRQLAWAAIGVFVFLLVVQMRLQWLTNRWVVATALVVTYVLLALVFTQSPINGTQRWLHAFGVSFQPSELAKLTAILFLSYYLSRAPDLRERPFLHLLRIAAPIVPMLALIVFEPDLGSVVILLVIVLLYLFLAGFPVLKLALAGAAVLPVLVVVVLSSPYMLNRIRTFMAPDADPRGIGYHINQSLIAMGHSGFWGLGLGESTQKLYFLPEPHTDFIFAVVGEELGFLGCLAIVALFGYLFCRGIKAAIQNPVPMFNWLGLGLITLIVIEVLINTSMVISLGPTKGIPLPFISMGGTSLLINLLAMGVVINFSREYAE